MRATKEEILETIPEDRQMGDCFHIHFDNLPHDDNYRLVHGVVTGQGPIKGLEISHCWLEVKVSLPIGEMIMVKDISNGNEISIPKELYYLIGKIDPDQCVHYDYYSAKLNAFEHQHYGPWHQQPEHVL
ncbi:putative Gp61 [Vibrio coralliirubri]|uniref:hypothetical protein n=1 Tax=Vibrio coralliirubri TaxID=1516159 RepID=UPI000639A63A|nr:hypothetical protein [Vibrio coralliirubri]CDT53396.1 putative Gp61 [Vibrio coralliirubri]